MKEPREKIELVRLWVEKAEADYKACRALLKLGDDSLFDPVCFHAQQCVEKYLKARLVHLSIDFPKTHDITKIIRLFPPGSKVPLTDAEQEKLTDYAWIGRYPGDLEPVTRQQAQEATNLAAKVRKATRAGFPKKF